MTSIFLRKLIASGFVFAVLFIVLSMATNEFGHDKCSDFLFAAGGLVLLFSVFCAVAFALFQIWGA